MQRSGSDWTVYEVYTNRDAYAQGVRVGDVVEQIGTMPLTGQGGATVQGLLDSYALGQRIPLTTRRGSEMSNLNVLVEDLLPHYPPPT
jgi:hypothetical protein